ncbi:MAG: hypothetical protein ACLQVX_04515 [Limisphaerales bacterium]
MSAKYCYWSVCDGAYGALMEHCVSTARQAGVFKEFHVLTDRPLAGCECYDAMQCDKTDGMFKLHYLKVGMSRLAFDYFIWLDADTVFVRNPADVLGPLGRSPIHVPLEVNLSTLSKDSEWRGASCFHLRDLYVRAGVANQVYLSQGAFWIVRRDAIESVYELAFKFWHLAKGEGQTVDVNAALGYAMQMLCANPEAHLITADPSVWASDDMGCLRARDLDGTAWDWRHPLESRAVRIHPAIIHLPWRKDHGGPNPERRAPSAC